MSDNDDILLPPWTDEQIDLLNKYQKYGRFHPYTCCGGSRDSQCPGNTVLVATKDGWKCPVCGRLQDWAHKASLTIWRHKSGIDFIDAADEEMMGEKLLNIEELQRVYGENCTLGKKGTHD